MKWHGLCLPLGGPGKRNSVAMHESRGSQSTYINMSIKIDVQTLSTTYTTSLQASPIQQQISNHLIRGPTIQGLVLAK